MVKNIRNKTRDLNIRPYIVEGSGFIDYFKNVFGKNSKFTNSTQGVLDKYGNYPVVQLEIRRQPIIKAIDTALNVLSLGTWQSLKSKNSFDSLFHLFSVVTVLLPNGDKKKILLEKNQSINVSEKIPERQKDTEILIIAIPKNTFTINSMLEKTHKAVGSDRFFVYRPFNDSDNGGNCQRFMTDVLRSNNLLGPRYESWILQDIEPLVKGLPNYVKKFSQGITDFASKGEKLLGLGKKKDVKYLKLVRLIAETYGYIPKDIKLANDGTHKLSIKHNGQHIKFGKQGMNDYIKYFLSGQPASAAGDEKMAVRKRNAYLKRSENIKGDWASDMYSKNSLARNILWMAPKKMGSGFNEVEMKLKNIGSGNDLEEVEENSISDFELKKYLPDAKIIMYPDLKNYRTIEEILPSDKSYAVILYLQEKNNGHWVSIKRNKNKIEFFCSYGSKVDEPLSWISKKKNKELGQNKPYLTNLLNGTKMMVNYNDVPYQATRNDIASCGRHVVFNIINFLDSGMNLKQYYTLMKRLKKLHKMDYDEIVSKYVNLILD